MSIITASEYRELTKSDLEKKVRKTKKVNDTELKHCGCRMLWEFSTFTKGIEAKTYICLKCDYKLTLTK